MLKITKCLSVYHFSQNTKFENNPNLEKMGRSFPYGNSTIKYAMHEMQILNHKYHKNNFCDFFINMHEFINAI